MTHADATPMAAHQQDPVPNLMPTPPKSSGTTAYDALIGALRAGRYRPGDRLREEEVASSLGLSRTPVREALRRLESDGIVVHQPRSGAVIRKLEQAELVELYQMRVVLERTAAEMAAQHGSEEEFAALEALNTRIAAECARPALGAALNRDFHRGLYRAARNRFLAEAARGLNNALLLLGPSTYADPGRVETVTAEHRAILDALCARDARTAGEAAEAHLRGSLRYRLETDLGARAGSDPGQGGQ